MIEDFEVIEKETLNFRIIYIYKFKLNNDMYYSAYRVWDALSRIIFSSYYFMDPKFKTERIPFSKELQEEIKKSILKQKEFRLRNLMNPYTFV